MDSSVRRRPSWHIAALVAIGASIGTAVIVAIDVQLSLAAMDFSDPSTLPNMGPQVRYFFIPVLAAIALAVGSFLDLLLWLAFGRRPLRSGYHYVVLGICYSLSLAVLPLGVVLPNAFPSIALGPVFVLLAAGTTRWFLSSSISARAS